MSTNLDSRALRDALGTFATGICVITAIPEGEAPFGMTVNSFSSVSLDPALVLWNLQNNSECFPGFEKADKFAVNILADDQQALSNQYAKKGDHKLSAEHFRMGPGGTAIIRGAVTSFECECWTTYPGGDHTILVGKVLTMETNTNKQPLLFAAGQYRTLR